MIYNKEEIKGGRKLVASGPRNMQTRAAVVDTSDDIKELKAEITKLTSSKNITTSGYTQQQVDDMLNEAIEEVSIELEKKYVINIKKLKSTLELAASNNTKLKAKIENKEKMIEAKDGVILDLTTKITELSSRPITIVQESQVELRGEVSDRPSIDSVYIDPIEKGKEDKMESHVKTKEVKDDERGNAASSIDKLKSLMGKSPIKF